MRTDTLPIRHRNAVPAGLSIGFIALARNKHTKTDREQSLLEVARLDRRGYSQREIARALGISQPQVCYDLKAIRAKYQTMTAEARKAAVAEKRLQYREIRWELWQEWERSKKDAERSVREKRTVAGKAAAKGKKRKNVEQSEHFKVVITTEGRLGDPSYLGRVLQVLDLECKLDGLNAPPDVAPTNPDGDTQLGAERTLADRIAGVRALVEEFERETGQKAASAGGSGDSALETISQSTNSGVL
jgi:DNA-binding CsgD family transcriptional regulator